MRLQTLSGWSLVTDSEVKMQLSLYCALQIFFKNTSACTTSICRDSICTCRSALFFPCYDKRRNERLNRHGQDHANRAAQAA